MSINFDNYIKTLKLLNCDSPKNYTDCMSESIEFLMLYKDEVDGIVVEQYDKFCLPGSKNIVHIDRNKKYVFYYDVPYIFHLELKLYLMKNLQ